MKTRPLSALQKEPSCRELPTPAITLLDGIVANLVGMPCVPLLFVPAIEGSVVIVHGNPAASKYPAVYSPGFIVHGYLGVCPIPINGNKKRSMVIAFLILKLTPPVRYPLLWLP